MDKIAEIKGVLRQLGITPDLNGYHYLVKAVDLLRHDFKCGKTARRFMDVYQSIAEEFESKSSCVERCMRHAIKQAMENGSELYDILFGNLKVVTISSFISIVAEYVS